MFCMLMKTNCEIWVQKYDLFGSNKNKYADMSNEK